MVRVEGVEDDEVTSILAGQKGPTKRWIFRLSEEARRILDREAKRLRVDRTKTLELLLREVRELRKKKR